MHLALHSAMRDSRAGASADADVYTVLAARARATSPRVLGAIAAAAGVVALAAVVLGIGDWTLLTACYLVWSFAVWGLVFGPAHPPTRRWRAVELFIVVSDTVLAIALGIGLFFLALGPRWML